MARRSFQYEAIEETSVRKRVQGQAAAIRQLLERTAESIVEIGQRLREVRGALPPGTFRAWLETEFRWQQSTASNYMQAAEIFGEVNCLRQFQPSAVIGLARRNVPDSVVAKALALARTGELITYKTMCRLLADHGVQPSRRDAGKSRKPVAAPSPAGTIDVLRETLDRFATDLDDLATKLSRAEREALADRFLRLALQLREPASVMSSAKAKGSKKRELAMMN